MSRQLNIALLWTLVLFAVLGRGQSSLYEDSNVVVIAGASDFARVVQSDGVWMVQFCAPDDSRCKEFAEQHKEIASIFKGIVPVAAVDVTSEGGKELATKLKVKDHGSLYIFGLDKMKPTKYEGERDVQSLSQALLNGVVEIVTARGQSFINSNKSRSSSSGPSKVVPLTAANFDEQILKNPLVSMVAFIAPWCGHCKNLLPEWHQAAAQLDGEGVILGVVDATVEQQLAATYGVNGYPTIKVFPGGANKSHSDAMDYQGERTAGGIVRYALAEVDRTGVPKEIPELTSMQLLEENCQGHNRICVIAALPHILDSQAAGRNKYRDLLASVAKGFRGSTYQFLWFEGSSQMDFEQGLELTFGYPALVALSLERQAYAVMRGSFSEKAITSFLHSITTGRQPTIKLDAIPELVTVEPWDGEDGVPLYEDPPLSEIMGDEF